MFPKARRKHNLGGVAVALYRNNLKNRESGKEVLQNLHAERATIAQGQGASEHAGFGDKPMLPGTDSSGYFGINISSKAKEVSMSNLSISHAQGGWPISYASTGALCLPFIGAPICLYKLYKLNDNLNHAFLMYDLKSRLLPLAAVVKAIDPSSAKKIRRREKKLLDCNKELKKVAEELLLIRDKAYVNAFCGVISGALTIVLVSSNIFNSNFLANFKGRITAFYVVQWLITFYMLQMGIDARVEACVKRHDPGSKFM